MPVPRPLLAVLIAASSLAPARGADAPLTELERGALFASERLSADTPGHAVAIDVALGGAERIHLLVTDAGDGISCDFLDWVEPRFVDAGGAETRLTDLEWEEARTTWGEIAVGRNVEGGRLSVHGKPVARGIGAHAWSLISYRVPEGAERFRARAGLDTQGTEEGCGSTVRVLVLSERPDLDVFDREREPEPDAARVYPALPGERIRTLPGFRAELVYSVPLRTQGSWVSLAVDDRGRLIASAQHRGLYRVTLPEDGQDLSRVRVEPIAVDVGMAQGLLWAFDGLYAMVNANERSGLWKITDSDGDGELDRARLLREVEGWGEHGPHAVVPAPDGKGLFIVAGNATSVPRDVERYRISTPWREDRLHRRIGASDGWFDERKPGGWIARIDPDGQHLELFASGFRNPYDIAFGPCGELFTFDADMEWDEGTPWYRPTRVNHVTSGAEFGWRAGSAKWPDTYLDSLGSVVDVGFSSPTGVVFGAGARFPATFQRAFLIGDWSFGKIFAVHLEPDGTTWTGTFEQLAAGEPLPVTDMVVRPQDGALYFTVGGRGITSALYRLVYEGEEPAGLAGEASDPAAPLREARRRLETFHGRDDARAVDAAWPWLAHRDRGLRYAARIAIEHQPVSTWRERALEEREPRALVAAMVALARSGDRGLQSRIVSALGRVEWADLDTGERLDWLRAHALCLTRLGRPEGPALTLLRARLDGLFPAGEPAIDRELCELLVWLEAPGIIRRTLDARDRAVTQEETIHYMACLRDVANGWTLELRRRYFRWFHEAVARGGVSFGGYLDQIRKDAIETLTSLELRELGDLLEPAPVRDPYEELKRRPLVRQWTVADLVAAADAPSEKPPDLERGRRVFSTATCYRCHRFRREGGITGPDLTGVTQRFDARSLLEAMLEPSRVISDQYAGVDIVTSAGDVITGKITDLSGDRLTIMTDLLNPAALEVISRADILQMETSETSLMPAGLLDTFSREEIVDLIEYLRSGARAGAGPDTTGGAPGTESPDPSRRRS